MERKVYISWKLVEAFVIAKQFKFPSSSKYKELWMHP
jgi:hypothetical protein